ncbi:MAG: hypothetical protein R3F61_30730 [Myxococcota bacterium]
MQLISRAALAALLVGGAATQDARAADADGCWSGRAAIGSCLVEHKVNREGGKISVTYKNQCTDRLYASACNKSSKGFWDCGSSGISPGKTWTWTTYSAEGSHKAKATGSNNLSKDWVCAGKVPNWTWKH